MVTRTLDAMAAGGIYDHVGGGFARYSTDERWLVPHFEKMLYDNALLARTYLEAFQVTRQSSYRQVVSEVLDYILREMTDPQGGFYSSTDADSEGIEGKFFVWTPAEVRAALRHEEDARRVCGCYDITDQGNWEHHSIPNRLKPLEAVAKELNVTVDELRETMNRTRPLLYEARRRRIPPGLDDKVITAWNGMMIGTMAEAGRVLGIDRYVAAARRAADFLFSTHRTASGALLRTSRGGHAHLDAVLEDYAYLGEGLVDLYEACGVELYLSTARTIGERLIESFQDHDHGGFFTTAREHETLIVRGREGADGATPSGNAVAAFVLARLSFHYDRRDFRDAAIAAVRAYGKQVARYPKAFAKSLAVVDFLTEGPIELALVAPESDPGLKMLQQAIQDIYLPNRILATTFQTDGRTLHPLLSGKTPLDGKPALYICRNFFCQQSLSDPREAADALSSTKNPGKRPPDGRLLAGQALPGFATTEGTARYASRLVNQPRSSGGLEHGYLALGATGLTVSKLGFGCYRIDASDPEFSAALIKALKEGVNLVDTSTNYMDGDSERVVGSTLRHLIAEKILARDEIIVVSKIGYVQGQNLKQAEAREKSRRPYPDMVKYGEGIWHCVHPEFLADQLAASLDRLGLETLDVCLLHNPEYFLSEAARRGGAKAGEQRDRFYHRMELAFSYFESQVAAGRIRWYGVSSNTVTAPSSDAEATSLFRFLDAATRAAASQGQAHHHFALLQCPMNLFESGALITRNTGVDQQETVLELAQRERLSVLVNRPLNAMPGANGGMIRLADFPFEAGQVNIDAQLSVVRQLEQEYRTTLAPSIPNSGQGTAPAEFFKWGAELTGIQARLQGLEHWEQIEHQMIAPHVNQVLQSIPRLVTGQTADQWESWRDRYLPELLTLLRGFRREATERSRRRTGRVVAAIDPLLPDERRSESLSRKALWILASTPGVTCVLNGMRSRSYVEDSLGVLQWKGLPEVRSLYEKARSAVQ